MGTSKTCENIELLELDEIPITTQEYNSILNFQQEILDMVASHESATSYVTK